MIVLNLESPALFTERGVKIDHHGVHYLLYFLAKGANIDNFKRCPNVIKPYIRVKVLSKYNNIVHLEHIFYGTYICFDPMGCCGVISSTANNL